MKKVSFWLLLGAVLSVVFLSCDKDDVKEDEGLVDDKPSEEVVEPRRLTVTKTRLGNQYTSDDFPSYYNLYEGKAFSDSTMAADFVFLSFNEEVKFVLTRYSEISEENKQLLTNKGKVCADVDRKTEFYKLPKSFRAADFDTLKSVVALEDLIDRSKLSTLPGIMARGYFYSDEYGWTEGTMVGVKDEEGRLGIIKMDDFSKMVTDDGKELVSMRITVKYDKREE